jgi:hypothetical protein
MKPTKEGVIQNASAAFWTGLDKNLAHTCFVRGDGRKPIPILPSQQRKMESKKAAPAKSS